MPQDSKPLLRLYYLEDNPLIVMHVTQLIEELGHICIGASASFSEFQVCYQAQTFDIALIDIDLADGRTGPDAAKWLKEKGVATVFVTGQDSIAAEYRDLVGAVVAQPVSAKDLRRAISKCVAARAKQQDG